MTSVDASNRTAATGRRRDAGGASGAAVYAFSSTFRTLIALLFAANMAFSIYLVRLGIGPLPVRVIFTLTAFVLIWMVRPRLLSDAVWLHRKAIAFVVLAAMIAAGVSLANRIEIGVIVQQIAEIYGQAVFGILIGYMLYCVCGVNTVIYVFVGVIFGSAAVAILQFLNFEPAWQLYLFLQSLQPQSITEDMFWHDVRYRALGLSYTPVHLATQICIAFAAFYAYSVFRHGEDLVVRRIFLPLWIVFAIGLVGCIASGNRSPMLGLAVFLFFFLVKKAPWAAIILGLGGIAVLLFGDLIVDLLQNLGLRVLNTENSSSEGRAALRLFGTLLFLDNPFGYGVDFDSTKYWWLHWQDVQNLENPDAIMIHALHNYYLMILNKNGVLIVPFLAVAGWLLWKNKLFALGLLPYVIHIFYHNDGPLQGDFMFWYIYPLFQATYLKMSAAGAPRRSVPRRRLTV
jgi:hypothetical protein